MKDYVEIIGSTFERGYALPPTYETICVICDNKMECVFDEMDEMIGHSCNVCGGSKGRKGDMVNPPVKW